MFDAQKNFSGIISKNISVRIYNYFHQNNINEIESDFFVMLSLYAGKSLHILINTKSDLRFYKERKNIDEQKLINGMHVMMSALLSIFLTVSKFENGLEGLPIRLRKLLFNIFEFTVEEKEMHNILTKHYEHSLIGGKGNMGQYGWQTDVHRSLTQALTNANYPIELARRYDFKTPVEAMDAGWIPDYRKGSEEYLKEVGGSLDFGITATLIQEVYKEFVGKIPTNFFENWKT